MEYDAIISGAGPAGTTCALFLAKQGRKVLLLEKEKFPRDKVCADNKTWKCLDIVKELGLWKEFQKLPKKEIRGVLVASPSGNEMYTPLREKDIEEKGPWYNVKRELFDNMLGQACKKNKKITLREKCSALKPITENGFVKGIEFLNEKGKSEQALAKVIVAADGSNSALAKELGHTPQIKGRYALNCRAYYKNVKGSSERCELYYLKGICPGYLWIFPVDNNTFNVGLGMRVEDIEKQGITLEEKMEEIIKSKRFAPRFENAQQISKPKKHGLSVLGGKRKWSGNGFLLIGDAGTFAMTFSGEGVGPSMRSGKIAAQSLAKAFEKNDFGAQSLCEFDERMWKILGPETRGFKWLEFLILNEVVFDWIVKRAAKKKELIEISSRMQRDYEAAAEMVSPRTIIKLLF